MPMPDFDWKKLVGGIAPTIATLLGGPLAGAAVTELGKVLLGKDDASESEVASILSKGLSPEQVVAIKQADNALAIRMRELDIDVLKINAAADAALIADTADARHAFSGNENVFIMGVFILTTFAVLMGLVLFGLFALMTGKAKVDPGVLTACGTLIGTIVGYVAATAQQVTSFFYGSSKGSKDSGDRLGAALTESIKQQSVVAVATK